MDGVKEKKKLICCIALLINLPEHILHPVIEKRLITLMKMGLYLSVSQCKLSAWPTHTMR